MTAAVRDPCGSNCPVRARNAELVASRRPRTLYRSRPDRYVLNEAVPRLGAGLALGLAPVRGRYAHCHGAQAR